MPTLEAIETPEISDEQLEQLEADLSNFLTNQREAGRVQLERVLIVAGHSSHNSDYQKMTEKEA